MGMGMGTTQHRTAPQLCALALPSAQACCEQGLRAAPQGQVNWKKQKKSGLCKVKSVARLLQTSLAPGPACCALLRLQEGPGAVAGVGTCPAWCLQPDLSAAIHHPTAPHHWPHSDLHPFPPICLTSCFHEKCLTSLPPRDCFWGDAQGRLSGTSLGGLTS